MFSKRSTIYNSCKLVKIYNIENILGTFGYSDSWDDFFLTEEERSLVLHYRKTPDMKPAVRKLLDME